jgi:pimeloyl-ACP methyl ester carboxylesterase
MLTLFALLMFVMVAGATAETAESKYQSVRVDEIYSSIRYAGPSYTAGEEQIVSFTNEGMNIVASLVLPEGVNKPPIVLFFNGFAGDRNELMFIGTDEYIWQRLSRILAEQGLASLRIDFRGSGDSDGDFTMTTFSTQISDALAALDYITDNLHGQVDTKRIGIIGFSQGGLVGSCTAARDKRVDSLCLWSPVSQAPMVYENLFLTDGMKQGLALEEGESILMPLYVNGEYVFWDVPLGDAFFDQVFQVSPLTEVGKSYKGPLFTICGSEDPIIWPQPHQSEIYLTYHKGFEKLVMLEADHAFNWWDGPEPPRFHDAIYWSAAWFLHTLEH